MRLFEWEDELVEECIERLTSIILQVDVEDRWIWNLHPSSCYTVNNAYKHLSEFDVKNN